MPKPNQILYAFWDYDLCPYMIGGIVTEFLPSGKVRVKGYDGMAFKPIAILPDEDGKRALTRLKQIRFEFSEAEKALKNDYRTRARINIALEAVC
jgi:hypothetical protein